MSEPSETSVKTAKVPGKKRVTRVEAAPAIAETPATAKGRIKGPRKAKSVAQAEVPKLAPATAGDEMSDLIQLEEENKRLRAALAEKLQQLPIRSTTMLANRTIWLRQRANPGKPRRYRCRPT
ncbi:hypothetical protein AB4Z52_28345 [Rhizobium sp. 2YAF20]